MEVKKSENDARKSIIDSLDKSMSVEAGAGAGKTTLIVNRVINQLKSGEYKTSELVIITFTNAAAEEVRGRIMQKLRDAAKNPANTAEEAKNLNDAVRDEGMLQISTIHSFCHRLLTEQTFAAKLPMDVELLDNNGTEKKKRVFFNEWYKTRKKDELANIEKEFYKGRSGEAIFTMFSEICDLPENTNFKYDTSLLSGRKLQDYMTDMEAQINRIITEAKAVIDSDFTDRTFKTFDDVVNYLAPDGKTRIIKKPYPDIWEILQEKKKSGVGFEEKELIDLYKKLWKDRSVVPPMDGRGCKALNLTKKNAVDINAKFCSNLAGLPCLSDEFNAYQGTIIADEAIKAKKDYETYCKKAENRHTLTNDALLTETLVLLQNNKAAREYFQKKFRCIYVDEFQDTDRVQRDLVELICANPGSMFFVGDPKQSIYAFRGADVEVYEDTRAKYTSPEDTDNEIYTLGNNYRSEKTVVDWVNQNFKEPFDTMFKNGYPDMTAQNDNPQTVDSEKILNGVYTLDFPNWILEDKKDKTKPYSEGYYGAKSAKKNKPFDAKKVVAIVKHLTEDGIKIWDKKKDGENDVPYLRAIEYKDFLIMCNKKADINIYADELKKAGITVDLYGALDTNREDVLIRVRALYHYLAYPYDSKAKHGAMQVLLNSALNAGNILDGRDKAEKLFEKTKRLTGLQTLQYLMHNPEYLLGKGATGPEMVRTQSRLQQLLEYVMKDDNGEKKDIDRKISEYMTAGVERDLQMETDINAVRFMNLHKAKGLEGRIVIIAGRARRKSKNDKMAYRDGLDFYPVAKAGTGIYQTGFQTFAGKTKPSGEWIEDLVEKKESEEWTRQDYVEATRGMEAVIFMDALESGAVFNSFNFSNTKKLADVSEGLKKDLEKKSYNPESTGKATIDYDFNEWEADLNNVVQSCRTYRSVTPSGVESHDGSWKPGDDPEKRPQGNIFGTVMHRSFELLVNKLRGGSNGDEKLINTVIAQAIMDSYEDIAMICGDSVDCEGVAKEYQNYLVTKLTGFLENKELIGDIKAAKDVYTEMGFSMYADEKEVGKVNSALKAVLSDRYALDKDAQYWVNGEADLVIVGNDGKVKIIDYKSDHRGTKTNEELEAHLHKAYDNQQNFYRYAIAKSLGVDVEKVTFEYYHMYE